MNKKTYEFGDFLLDLGRKQLKRDGQNIALQPKVFDVLAVLIERHGEIVSLDELMSAVWADTFVEETNLRFCIHALRKVLGEGYVETVPKRGYRLMAEVREKSSELIAEDETSRDEVLKNKAPPEIRKIQSAKPIWLAGISIVSIVCLLILAVAWQKNKIEPATNALGLNTIAVLPFVSVGETDAGLQMGLADALITNLSRIEQLKILPIGSIQKYAGQNFDSLKTGRELNADAVLEGSYRFENEDVRVTGRLLRVSDGAMLWTETFTAQRKGNLELENALALRTARLLWLKIAQAEDEQNLVNQNIKSEAVQNYLAARRIGRTGELFRRTEMLGHFEKAIELEPNWTLARVGYGDALLSSDQLLVEWEKAEQTANKLIELDATLAAPHAVLGEIYQWRDWNWEKSEDEFKTALSLDPNHAPTHHKYSEFLRIERRFAEAEEEIKKALELEPFSPIFYASLCEVHYFDRKFDQALNACRYSQQIEPNFWRADKLLFWIYVQKKMYHELGDLALGKLSADEKAKHPLTKAIAENDLRLYWQSSIERDFARYTDSPRPMTLAMTYLQLGEKEKALDYLEQAQEQRFQLLPRMNVDCAFDSVRGEKRFAEIIQKIGLQK